MADAPSSQEPKPPSGWRAVMGFVQQWQVLLPLVVGLFGLWFSISDRRTKEIELDREAVKAARETPTIAGFREDPQGTLTEFRATYPPHAFCAALGFFIAENARAARRSGTRDAAAKDAVDSLRAQVETLALRAGLDPPTFDAFVAAAEASAGDTPADSRCLQVAAVPAWYAPYLVEPECLMVLDIYGQGLCSLKRAEMLQTAANDTERAMETSRSSYVLRPPPVAGSEPAVPGSESGSAPAPGFGAPGAVCGTPPPLIYPQFAAEADKSRIAGLRELMLRADWNVAPADLVATSRTSGDVRIYAEAQRPCAEQLARALADWLGRTEPLPVISLAERYRGLPKQQMEIWLPPLSPG